MLTDAEIRKAKPEPKLRRLGDSGQLYVLINPSGSKLWRIDYSFGRNAAGKPMQKTLSFGACLRTHEIAFEDIDYALPVEEAWNALEGFHGLPLTQWEAGAGWAEHVGKGVVMLLVERISADALQALQGHAARRTNLFVYAFAPGQLRSAVEGLDVEVLGVREALVRRFVP